MADTVDSAPGMNQGSLEPNTLDPDVHIVSMARVMLGNIADSYGDCDEDSFVKGYEKGFDKGWSFGYRKAFEKGRKQGRAEAEAEFKKRAEEKLVEGGEECRGQKHDGVIREMLQAIIQRGLQLFADTPSRTSWDDRLQSDVEMENIPEGNPYCLLSDVALSPIREEDVFHDAASSFSIESEDLMDVFYDADQSLVASGSESVGNLTNTEPTEPTEQSARALTPAEPEEEDLLDLSYDDDKSISVSSPISTSTVPNEPKENIITSPPTEPNPTPTTFLVPLARTSPLLPWNQDTTTTTTNNYPTPITLALTRNPNTPFPSKLYNIRLPHPFNPTSTLHPILPDLSTPPSALRPRPAYPTLTGDHNNIYALARQGKTVVEDPWRVLIGPLSESARFAWKGDCGKGYIRGKLGGYDSYLSRGGGEYHNGGFRGGAGRGGGFGRGGWDRHRGMEDGGEGENVRNGGGGGGVAFCQMVTDVDGQGYVLAMFESQEKAREAERSFWGYACGGSIMWAWIYQEAE